LHRYDERGEGTSLRSEVKKLTVTSHQICNTKREDGIADWVTRPEGTASRKYFTTSDGLPEEEYFKLTRSIDRYLDYRVDSCSESSTGTMTIAWTVAALVGILP
jgi:hypothetical protein